MTQRKFVLCAETTKKNDSFSPTDRIDVIVCQSRGGISSGQCSYSLYEYKQISGSWKPFEMIDWIFSYQLSDRSLLYSFWSEVVGSISSAFSVCHCHRPSTNGRRIFASFATLCLCLGTFSSVNLIQNFRLGNWRLPDSTRCPFHRCSIARRNLSFTPTKSSPIKLENVRWSVKEIVCRSISTRTSSSLDHSLRISFCSVRIADGRWWWIYACIRWSRVTHNFPRISLDFESCCSILSACWILPVWISKVSSRNRSDCIATCLWMRRYVRSSRTMSNLITMKFFSNANRFFLDRKFFSGRLRN